MASQSPAAFMVLGAARWGEMRHKPTCCAARRGLTVWDLGGRVFGSRVPPPSGLVDLLVLVLVLVYNVTLRDTLQFFF
jgi:hypothetical protein